jgi:hypothetical protein
MQARPSAQSARVTASFAAGCSINAFDFVLERKKPLKSMPLWCVVMRIKQAGVRLASKRAANQHEES